MAISLPTASGNTGTNDWADVYNNDAQLVTEIDDRDGNYQSLLRVVGHVTDSNTAATYVLPVGGTPTASPATNAVIPAFYFDDADYAIASKTQKLRVRAQACTNAVAWSSVTATFGLYPITYAGAGLVATLGTVVSGSTVAIANPSASSVNQANSGDFTIPSDGQYTIGVVLSATVTGSAIAALHAQLQTRWV